MKANLMGELDLDAIEERAAFYPPRPYRDVTSIIAELRALREQVATLESGITRLLSMDGVVPAGTRNYLRSLLDASHNQRSVVHACPPGDEGLTPCCGRTPFELPSTDRMTLTERYVTCDASHEGDSRE